MILTVDVGNTNIVLGVFFEDDLKFVARIATNILKTEDEYAAKIRSVLKLHNVCEAELTGAIISSVVPPLNNVLKKAIKMVYAVEPIMVGPGIKTGINIKCDDPSSVGADLITVCVATHFLYGSPALIIDMGTATKILAMDKTGAFCGASIIPGVKIALGALSGGAAQLPMISLEAPSCVLGKNTIDCMRSGVILGNASMLDGMIDRCFEQMGKEVKVYATGGLSSKIVGHCKHDIILDEHLLLKGLNILYKKNQGNF